MAEVNLLNPEEEAFVNAFIVPDKRERYSAMLANPKKRSKILGLLYHNLDTIPAKTFAIADRDHNSVDVAKLLRQKGSGKSCYLISPEREFDQQEMLLENALETVISRDSAAIICCVPGHLAYYKAELSQFVLEQPRT